MWTLCYRYFNNNFSPVALGSEEVIRSSACDMRLSPSGCRVKHKEVIVHVFVHLHYACFIRASVAVVRRWKYCHYVLLVTPVVTLEKLGKIKHTFMTSWCALAMSLSPFVWLNCSDMSSPKVYPAPLGEIPQPHRSSGSDQSRSHIGPSWGTSWIRSS